MFFDSLTTTAVVDELRQRVLGGRVQRIVQVDPLSLGLELYAGERCDLLASADPRYPRLVLVDYKLRRGVETVSPLLLLVRKFLDGSRLQQIEQPPFERLIQLTFAGPEGETALVIELVERRANLILLQGGQILEAIQRVGADRNRFRTIQPGKPYAPPPPQNKLDPTDVTELRLQRMLADAEPERPLWRVLVSGVAGISPLLAREITFRATGDSQSAARDCQQISPLLDAFEEALIPYWEHAWQPSIGLSQDGRVTAFAPYHLTHLKDYQQVETISQAMGRYYLPLLGTDPYQAAKIPLQDAIQQAVKRVSRKRNALLRQAPDREKLDLLRQKGELLLAYAATIEPGQTVFKAQYDLDGPMLVIKLDARLTAVENAQSYFRDYEKGKRAAADIPKRLATADMEIAYLEQLAADLILAASWPEVDEVNTALANAGYTRATQTARPRGGASKPLRIVSQDGLVILVGRNSRQNEEVTFKRAAADDIWLHARGIPGGHVVIKSGGRKIPDSSLHLAARLAAGYSTARNELDVPVDWVVRKRVRRARGGQTRPGLVTYQGAQTVRVKPKQAESSN